MIKHHMVSILLAGLHEFLHQHQDVGTPIMIHDDKMTALGIIMMQMSLKVGLRQFGKWAVDGALKEIKQLHDMETFFPRHTNSLTKEE